MFDPWSCSPDETGWWARSGMYRRGRHLAERARFEAVYVPEPTPICRWHLLPKPEVAMLGLSKDAMALVHAYEEAGWTWRFSTKNHVVATSPCGESEAVSRNLYGKLARQKFRALERWKVENRVESTAVEEPPVQNLNGTELEVVKMSRVSSTDGKIRVVKQELSNGAHRFACAKCGWIGTTSRSVAQHFGNQHAPRKSESNGVSPAEDILAQIRSLVGTVDASEVAQLRAENEALRSENAAMREERAALRDLLK